MILNYEINNFFEIDDFILENKIEYLCKDICIVQYPKGNELSFTYGKIKFLNNIIIKYLVSIDESSSDSLILLRENNFKIKQGNKTNDNN